MELKPEDYTFIKTDADWNRFVKREKLLEYSATPVMHAEISGWAKFALIAIRIYIIIMVALVFLGFLHVI